MKRYDVVIATDLKLPGGTTASVAEEVRAQASAGYRTGLVHVPSPLSLGIGGLNPRIAAVLATGAADLLARDASAHARLVVFRHPGVFAQVPPAWPRLTADAAVVVVNQPPVDESGAGRFYALDEVEAVVARLAGIPSGWIPIGPLVREAVMRDRPDLTMVDWDWTNVLHPDEWAVDRPPLEGRKPVIGRHSRPQFQKWPDRVEDLLAAYPDDDRVEVAILGGAATPRRMLRRRFRRLPSNWTVHSFDGVPVQDFLAAVDFYVYFHHPGWVESFGRGPLEALASGAVTILPPHFEALFGPGAVYAEPGDVLDLVLRLSDDSDEYRAQAEQGRRVVAERFSWATHLDRLSRWLDRTDGAPRRSISVRGPVARARREARALLVSSNGSGMGHLTRLLAMARRTHATTLAEPVFFTLSQAIRSVKALGFPCEYYPSWRTWGIEALDWNRWFERRLTRMLDLYAPDVVVFDGTVPYPGLLGAAAERPDLRFVWSRRAMWIPGRAGDDRLDAARHFAVVVEPGELAAAYDRGETTRVETGVERVDPIVLFDREELLAPTDARIDLGLDPDGTAVLITLGAGNINVVDPLVEAAVDALAHRPDVQVCVTSPAIAARLDVDPRQARVVDRHPLARHLRAFDVAVAAAGYNTFHELLWAGVPAVFVPNEHTSLDDQFARARWAHDEGAAVMVREDDVSARLGTALGNLLDEPERRTALADRSTALFTANGAAAAAAVAFRGSGVK